jgi:predicted TPR repeat methyltransferase
MSDRLESSWGALTPGRAREYLRTYGAPSEGSKRLLTEVLGRVAGRGTLSIIDLGCGNGQLLEWFRASRADWPYTGVDFSEPLLEAAREAFADDPSAAFLHADVNTLEGVDGHWDVAVYSHVLEMIGSPERSLLRAAELADSIAIRFFEPPESDADLVELREMEVGDGATVPYLRRTIGRDYYRMILAKAGCKRVDVYHDESSKDQVHLLRF